METLGARLKELRQQKGLSQIELSKLSNIPQGTISRWETGARANPGWKMIQALAAGLGCSAAQLLPRCSLHRC